VASARTWSGILRVVAAILGPLLKIISPMIKDLFEDSLNKLLVKARATENPIDDLFVEFLFQLLGLDIPSETS